MNESTPPPPRWTWPLWLTISAVSTLSLTLLLLRQEDERLRRLVVRNTRQEFPQALSSSPLSNDSEPPLNNSLRKVSHFSSPRLSWSVFISSGNQIPRHGGSHNLFNDESERELKCRKLLTFPFFVCVPEEMSLQPNYPLFGLAHIFSHRLIAVCIVVMCTSHGLAKKKARDVSN